MNRPVAIIGAMDIEIQAFRDAIADLREERRGTFLYYLGRMFGKDVVLVKSGVGKVLSAITCQKLVDDFAPSHILMTGVAGALKDDLKVGDIVIGKDYIQHDVDAQALGLERGFIPDTSKKEFEGDPMLVAKAENTPPTGHRLVSGRILSGDQFLSEEETLSRKYLFADMHGDAIDMECAAVAQVCNVNRIPFLGTKTICSELHGNQEEQYRKSLGLVVNNSLSIIKSVLKNLSGTNNLRG
ncbi:hypothetical protein A2368_00825 [Candidatus Collierbacteria bacterium RIFOXYB1_FULL_49_13]|uniref:adenosylhomocysteine nucleosidase n=1 Tax=Candidatus Collierbacteria bacterium RIFOXYB1_FULL_49_13 TaxID=1817728 RepID=A0A1F5FHK2_9BACT|nr:MAG: hypothetical protein A2368_00825 [Candidatus Collierbacteria bacterium RIFOXYB1_FULL_49_13]